MGLRQGRYYLTVKGYMKLCEYCNKEFEKINKRIRFCCKSCSNKWRHANTDFTSKGVSKMADLKRNKTYEEIYGIEKANEIRKKASFKLSGENNPCFGRTGEKHPLYNKTWEDIQGKEKAKERKDVLINRMLEDNMMFNPDTKIKNSESQVRYYAKKYGMSFEDYVKTFTFKRNYYSEVGKITRMQNLKSLENNEKRGMAPNPEAYHLDHIISRHYGFINNIKPEIIGNISNLRFIPWLENIKKGNKLIYPLDVNNN